MAKVIESRDLVVARLAQSGVLAVTAALAAGEIDETTANEAIERIVASRSNRGGVITYKVSDKGAISVYGLNARFPVTLYREQWERLDSEDERTRRAEFISKNSAKLTTKN